MGKIALGLSLLGALIALAKPWIGIVDGYLNILLGPHVVWWWSFEGTRHFLIIAICTIIGFLISIARGEISFYWIKNKLNLYLFIWFIFTILSFIAGPYVDGGPGERYFPPDYIFSIMCKAFLFYWIAVLCIDDEKKLWYLCIVIVFAGIYFIYYINDQYLSGNYGFMGRLGGPKGLNTSQYGDENILAMFFVIALPFLYYFSLTLKNIFLKFSLLLMIPFGWHGIFLTGSRGGLIGMGVTILIIAIRSQKKSYGIILILAALIAFLWQGGPVMFERSRTIAATNPEEVDPSVQGRLDSWAAAIRMMIDHPFTGVGLSSFGMAYPDFSDADPREAHNTYLHIGAESGPIAMIAYILFLIETIKALWKRVPEQQSSSIRSADKIYFIDQMNNAVLTSWIGFAVCALFLSLQVFEQFFYLAIISNYLISYKKNISEI